MNKKLTVRAAAAVLAASMLTACGGAPTSGSTQEQTSSAPASYFNPTGERICDETITITMGGRQGPTKDWQNTIMIQGIEEKMGIHIDCQPVANDAWETQRTLMFSTDSLPDILTCTMMSVADVNNYGADGYFLPLNEYLEYMPNLQKLMEENPAYAKYITAPDGNIYGLTRLVPQEQAGRLNRVFINGEWLKNVGMEVPQTVDEFYNVLKAFKEQDANGNGDPNDEIPLL